MKNERAAIMALTFCIGFTTGLIAYGLLVQDVPVAYVPAKTQPASVASAESEASKRSQPVPPPPSVFSYVETGLTGFYHVVNGERILISPSVSLAPDLPETHTAIHTPVASRDARFVFFCAETTGSGGDCYPRVFAAETFSTHAVQLDAAVMRIDPANLTAAWTSDGLLQLNQSISTSADKPWVLQ